MAGKKGAPIGNRNAAGRHTGLTGLIGRAVGAKQLTQKDTAMVNAIVQTARDRRSTAGKLFGTSAKLTEAEWAKVIAAQKRAKPW
jgi:hypothetical protein